MELGSMKAGSIIDRALLTAPTLDFVVVLLASLLDFLLAVALVL